MDRHCEALFLSPLAQEKDDNLLFVRDRLLRNDTDVAGLLELYGQVWRGRRVVPDDTRQLISLLRLSGITRVESGSLRVRNRIYGRVFDREWITTHMPDAELRRQRAAFRRGLMRASAVAAVIVAAMAGLVFTAVTQARLARRATVWEARQRSLAEERERAARRYLYASQMKLVQQAWEEGNLARARGLLEAWRPEPGQDDLRGFEWRYLWRLCQDEAQFTFSGLSGWVNRVAFSPDGRMLVAASGDSVWLGDPVTRRKRALLKGPIHGIVGLAFSPDGKTVAAGGGQGIAALWKVTSRPGAPLRVSPCTILKGHKGEVGAVAFSPDGKLLALGSDDNAVRLWDVAARRALAVLKGHHNRVRSAAFSPDGKLLASASWDHTVRLWDVASRRELAVLRGHKDWVNAVAFSPNGKLLASGSDDSTVKLWDVSTRREIVTLGGHRDRVEALAFSPDGRTLATTGLDRMVKLWDLTTRQERATFKGHTRRIFSLAFSPDGRLLASGDDTGVVKLWDPARRAHAPLQSQQTVVIAIAFAPNGKTLAAGTRAEIRGRTEWPVQLWDAASGQRIATLLGHKAFVGSVTFSPDSKTLASGAEDGTIRLWDRSTKRQIAVLRPYTGGMHNLGYSPDGKILAAGSSEGRVTLWDLASRRPAAVLKAHRGAVMFVGFSADGRLLATSGDDGNLKLWDVPSRREMHFKGPTLAPPFAFSKDGKALITGSSGTDALTLWDLATSRAMVSMKGPAEREAVALSPDGHTVALCGGTTITLWNLVIRQEVLTLKGHTAPVYAAAFSPDGSTLASASGDGTVRLWRAPAFPETDSLQVGAAGHDRAVTLQWQPLSYAQGYNLYRGPADAARAQLARLNRQPLSSTIFTDSSAALVNGRAQTYGIAAVYRGADAKLLEGRMSILQAAPVAVPPGWIGCSINEGSLTGVALFDAVTGTITVRGFGQDIWGSADGCYFAGQPVTGDFQITVRELARPTKSDEWAKAGLMIRETLEPGARNAHLVTTPLHGIQWQWRPASGDGTQDQDVVSPSALRLPITLRLVRRGSTITAATSSDNGQHFVPAGEPVQFETPLAKTVYAGLVVSSHNPGQMSEAKFQGLEIRKQ